MSADQRPPGQGLLLVNLGTPDAPTPDAVRRYLAQFLSDPRVVELPRFIWLPLLHGVILRRRPRQSAAKYAKVWTDEGSPLAVHTRKQASLVGALPRSPWLRVDYAMRYGQPDMPSALARMRAAGCRSVRVLPLYPQYAASTTGSVRDALKHSSAGTGLAIELIESFCEHPSYIAALEASVRRHWANHGRAAVLIASFHGLPQRAVDRGDPYEDQCYRTATRLREALELPAEALRVTFQSRFGPARWLQPYTEPTLARLASDGSERVDVICPGFVSDCLETLEEIGIGARGTFLSAGGREFRLIECLNESTEWIAAIGQIARDAAVSPV